MKQRLISDEFFAGALWGSGMAIMIFLWFNHSPGGQFTAGQSMLLSFGGLCCAIGGSLYRLVQHRKRLKLDAPEKPNASQAQ